jgi:hypothetical protein
MTAAHARLSPSSAKRWINCPGSVNACANLPNKSSVFADEGKRAHAFSETAGLQGLNAHEVPGIEFEMIPHVQLYLDTLRWDYALAYTLDPNTELRWEQRYALPFLPGEQFGTTDGLLWSAVSRTLKVYDLKYGAGVAVDPVENEQALLYAGGAAYALNLFEGAPFTVEIVIVQPRAMHPDGPVRRWQLHSSELSRRLEDMRVAAERTYDANAPLVPGEWCRFCANSGRCEAQDRLNVARIQDAFGSIETPPPPVRIEGETDGQRIARYLGFFPVVRRWMDAVEAQAFNLAYSGQEVPGHKLVAKVGRRAWAEGVDVAAALRGYNLADDDIFEKKLVSPPKVEALLGKKTFQVFAAATSAVSRNSSGYDLVLETDRRPAIDPKQLEKEQLSGFTAISLDD